jgi:glutathione S-transferase
MTYQLHYWPTIQGRGEFVRLALEAAGAAYVDVAREPKTKSGVGGGGEAALMKALDAGDRPSFAPPFLVDGDLTIGQTANILLYLGPRLDLAPKDESGRAWVNQLQATITDLVVETHDTHHPVDNSQYYEDQKPEAKRAAQSFTLNRMPKYLGWYERVLTRAQATTAKGWLTGAELTYADLSLFQVVEGLRYAFPNTMKTLERNIPRVVGVRDRVAALPTIATYLASPRRIPFNQMGIFRYYPELDAS